MTKDECRSGRFDPNGDIHLLSLKRSVPPGRIMHQRCYVLTPNVHIKDRFIPVGAAFQPRLNNDGVIVTYFRGWPATSSAEQKPLPREVGVNLMALT
jgi:hypothetical protein